MRRIFPLVIALVIIFGLTFTGRADLKDMGDGTVYDTDTQLTWLKDAGMGGKRTWLEAGTWTDNLVFAGFNNWRLPLADPSCGPSMGCTGNEMGHLYYTELQNSAGGPLTNTGPFTNLYPDVYWCGGNPPWTGGAWYYTFMNGGQMWDFRDDPYYAWAVCEGQRSVPTPEPSIMILLGISMASVVGLRRWWRE